MIYIIDDDKSVRRSFEILLSSADFAFRSFESAEEFLEFFTPQENDFLILDIHMQGMNGCELLNTLLEKNIHIPVIIITAFDEAFSRKCAKNYGVKAYLRKPIDGEALIDLIRYNI